VGVRGVTDRCWRGSRAELQGDRKDMNLVQVNVTLVSTLILAVVSRVGERLPQPLLALRRLDQRLRQLLHAVQGSVISAPGEGAGGERERNTAHIGTPEHGVPHAARAITSSDLGTGLSERTCLGSCLGWLPKLRQPAAAALPAAGRSACHTASPARAPICDASIPLPLTPEPTPHAAADFKA